MSDPQTHDRESLSEALANMPSVAAGDGFSAAVLAEWRRRRRRSRAARRVALVAGLAVATLVVALMRAPSRPGDTVASGEPSVELLQREHRLIEQELRELRALADEPLPLIYLGGDDEIDVVVDPELLLYQAAAQPAVYRY